MAVHNKSIYAEGKPEDIVTQDMVRKVFQMECEIAVDPLFGTLTCIPHGRGKKLNGEQRYTQLAWFRLWLRNISAAEVPEDYCLTCPKLNH
ncbi:hypothetical protein [Paenibacillus xylanexedens]|uniref:hypothetical protein n=1 Tax=Paenibacillus xylanexedens TaxID=528191 RepID=UPI003D01406C